MEKIKIGYAFTGSFCTFAESITRLTTLAEMFDVTPIMSFNAHSMDTKFGRAADFNRRIEDICGRPIIHTIADAEPVGTTLGLRLVAVVPCTGNTLAKIANGITDTPVTMAVKAQLRNNRPVLIGISSNDALGANARNLGQLLNTKNVYFVPFRQDSPLKKTNSLIADLSILYEAVENALAGVQIQPVML